MTGEVIVLDSSRTQGQEIVASTKLGASGHTEPVSQVRLLFLLIRVSQTPELDFYQVSWYRHVDAQRRQQFMIVSCGSDGHLCMWGMKSHQLDLELISRLVACLHQHCSFRPFLLHK